MPENHTAPLHEVTELLAKWGSGDVAALGEVWSAVYAELHRLADRAMRGERSEHTLQTTALLHEAYLRLARERPRAFKDRGHFYAVATRLMRHILVDHARRLATRRRGGDLDRAPLEEAALPSQSPELFLCLHEGLEELANLEPRQAHVVELRFLAGLSVEETAQILGVSAPTVILDTRLARAWLYDRIYGDRP